MVQRFAVVPGFVGAGRRGLARGAPAVRRLALAAGLALALAACQDSSFDPRSRHMAPIPPATLSLMAEKKMGKNDPIVIRSFKKESEVEVWKRGADGRFALLKTFPICRWSGQLGPKIKEGDRQAPEGFYAINPAQMNPNSSFHLSFDTGYPNAFDRAHGRTGSHLMVHGACSSRGCFAMTDEAISEIYAIAREAFAGGQRTFQFQSYPFRMTPKNLAQHRLDPNMPFWENLKEGSDYFEVTREEPKVGVCGKRYVFGGPDVAQGNCAPAHDPLVAQKREQDERQVAELVGKGTPAIRLVYDDGGQHESFRKALTATTSPDGSLVLEERENRRLGLVSRPEALASGPRVIMLDASGRPKDEAPATALALAPEKPEAKPAAPAQATAFASQKPAGAGTTEPRTTEPRTTEPRTTEVRTTEPRTAEVGAEPRSAARAEPDAPEPARRPAGEGKPFYQRMFNGIGSLVGSTSGPETAAAQPAPSVPVPPRRDAPAPARPQAAKPALDKPALERQAAVAN